MIITILANYDLNAVEGAIRNCLSGCWDNHEFRFGYMGKSDLVCVLNWPKRPIRVKARAGGFVKVVQEPKMNSRLAGLFVHRHSNAYDLVIGHEEARPSNRFNGLFERSPGFLPNTVLPITSSLSKTETVSVVASRLTALPGHRMRSEVVDNIALARPELSKHIFGKGRTPIESKTQALDSYMFSLAIENSAIEGYVTEKVTDCFLRGTVPIYFGAPDLGTFYPKESFIQLKSLEVSEVVAILDGLSKADYEMRIPALALARNIHLTERQLCCRLVQISEAEAGGFVNRTLGLEWGEILATTFSSLFRLKHSVGEVARRISVRLCLSRKKA